MEPSGVELNEQRDEENTQYIERVAAHPSEGDIPCFLFPSSPDRQHQHKPDETLFEAGTAPNNRGTTTGIKTDGMFSHQMYGVPEE